MRVRIAYSSQKLFLHLIIKDEFGLDEKISIKFTKSNNFQNRGIQKKSSQDNHLLKLVFVFSFALKLGFKICNFE